MVSLTTPSPKKPGWLQRIRMALSPRKKCSCGCGANRGSCAVPPGITVQEGCSLVYVPPIPEVTTVVVDPTAPLDVLADAAMMAAAQTPDNGMTLIAPDVAPLQPEANDGVGSIEDAHTRPVVTDGSKDGLDPLVAEPPEVRGAAEDG